MLQGNPCIRAPLHDVGQIFELNKQDLYCCYVLCSVSSLMTTTEAVVVELPKDGKEAPAAAPGMGGLGY